MAGRNTNNELLIKVVEETAAQKESLQNIWARLTDMSTDLKRVVSMTEKLHHTVYGNGQMGLVDRVVALQDWQIKVNETIHEAKGGGKVVAFLFGIGAALVGSIAERVFK